MLTTSSQIQIIQLVKKKILISDVVVFKDKDGKSLPVNKMCKIITAAAINTPSTKDGQTYLCNKQYKVMKKLIDDIFIVACNSGADTLVLGAFGCGAFGCPIEETASIMFETSKKYRKYFINIVFPMTNDYMFNKYCGVANKLKFKT